MKLRLDPRAKLYLLVLGNLTLFLHVSLATELLLVSILLSLYFLSGKIKSGIRMTAVHAMLVSIDIFVIPIAEGLALNVLSLVSRGIRMMLPRVISGGYAFSTTTVRCWIAAILSVHCIGCPNGVSFWFDIANFGLRWMK